jgi:hypothetical protein
MDDSVAKERLHLPETQAILENNSEAAVAVLDVKGEPLAFAVSYAYLDGRLYFHLTRAGYAYTGLENDAHVSVVVIDRADKDPDVVKSVSMQGTARILADPVEIEAAVKAVASAHAGTALAESFANPPAHVSLVEVTTSSLKGWRQPRL